MAPSVPGRGRRAMLVGVALLLLLSLLPPIGGGAGSARATSPPPPAAARAGRQVTGLLTEPWGRTRGPSDAATASDPSYLALCGETSSCFNDSGLSAPPASTLVLFFQDGGTGTPATESWADGNSHGTYSLLGGNYLEAGVDQWAYTAAPTGPGGVLSDWVNLTNVDFLSYEVVIVPATGTGNTTDGFDAEGSAAVGNATAWAAFDTTEAGDERVLAAYMDCDGTATPTAPAQELNGSYFAPENELVVDAEATAPFPGVSQLDLTGTTSSTCTEPNGFDALGVGIRFLGSLALSPDYSSADTGMSLQFNTTTTGGGASPSITYNWGDGSSYGPGWGTSYLNAYHSYSFAGTYTATAWYNFTGGSVETQATVVINAFPQPSLAVSPHGVVLGENATLWTNATGGTGPLSYAYTGLPAGCVSANVSELTCMPSATGTFQADAWVNDTVGQGWTVSQAFQVTLPRFRNWSEICASCGPAGRRDFSLAYDAAMGATILFGGYNATLGELDDTWEFKAGQWVLLNPEESPPAMEGAAMAYEQALGELVLFGGQETGNHVVGETWIFKAGNWTEPSLATEPQPRVDASMVWDAPDGYLVLFGGDASALAGEPNPLDDTWTFQGTQWTEQFPASVPSARLGAWMAADPISEAVVLFGGENWRGAFGDTWEYQGGSWTQLFPVDSPSPRSWVGTSVGATDTRLGAAVLYGGQGNSSFDGDTWEFVSGDWYPVNTTLPTPVVDGFGATYDPTSGGVFVFGGGVTLSVHETPPDPRPRGQVGSGSTPSNSTWLFGPWYVPPTIRSFSASPAEFDLGASVVLSATILGGSPQATLAYSGLPQGCASQNTTTLQCQPGAPGNYTAELWFNDSLGRSSHASASFEVGPALTVAASGAPNPTDVGVPVHFHAASWGGLSAAALSWDFGDGSGPSTAGGAVNHTFLHAGTYLVQVWANDTTEGRATFSWSLDVRPPVTLQLRATPDPVPFGSPVSLVASASGGGGPYTFSWVLGDGTTAGNVSSLLHLYAAGGPFVATVTASDSVGGIATASVQVATALQMNWRANTTLGASPLTVGFTSEVSGGVPTYNYSWNFGDGGTSWLPSPSHLYLFPGVYEVTLTVTDVDGNSLSREGNITVRPGGGALTAALTARSTQLTLGNSTLVEASISGGRGNYTVSWPGAPTWCVAINATALVCTPAATGNYTLNVEAIDSAGDAAHASTVLAVSLAQKVSPPPPVVITRTINRTTTSGLFGLPGLEGYLSLAAIGIALGVVAVLAAYRTGRQRGGAAARAAREPTGGASREPAEPRQKKTLPPSDSSDVLGDLF